MELAVGGTFRERARQLGTLGEAVAELVPIGDALQYAHARGIIHRDVKPINILIDEHQRSLLADFGLARIASESLDLTTMGTSAGTPHYMPPEQVLGKDVDHRSDIYAFGVLTYQLLAGQVPYDGPNPIAVMQMHLNEPVPSIRSVLPDAPARLDSAIGRSMAKRPDERFSSITDFLSELQHGAGEAPTLRLGAARGSEVGQGAERAPSATSRQVAPANVLLPDDWEKTVFAPLPFVTEAPSPARDQSAIPATAPRVAWHGRPTDPNAWQLTGLGLLLLLLAALAGLDLWAAPSAPGAQSGTLAGLASGVRDHSASVRVALAAVAALVAGVNVTFMRAAVLEDSHLSLGTYQRLRQLHRLGGYSAALLAIAGQALLWIELARSGTHSPLALVQLVLGLALLVLAVAKVGTVRLLPGWRQYLPHLGITLFVMFVVVLGVNVAALFASA